MIKNNYNTNANGPDIEVSIFYDIDLSYVFFKENVETLQDSSYYKNAIAYYHGGEGVPDLKWDIKGSTEDMKKYMWENNITDSDIDSYEDLIIDQLWVCYGCDSLIDSEDIAEHLAEYGLQWVCNREVFKHEIRGYSQGDYTIVYTHHENVSREYLTNLLYDAPISARMTVNGEEYCSKYDGLYEWDRDEAIEDFAKQTGLDKEEFEHMIPEQPDFI